MTTDIRYSIASLLDFPKRTVRPCTRGLPQNLVNWPNGGNCTPMSEAIQPEQPRYPGEAWTEIVRRPALEEFSRAFASDVVLEASVLSRPIVGPIGLWAFFQATGAMYERIGFTHEIGTKARMCLEWEGVFAGKPVAGVTIITRDDRGAITSVRLHHRPFDQVVAFAEPISRHLG
jgi:hypothetical protein